MRPISNNVKDLVRETWITNVLENPIYPHERNLEDIIFDVVETSIQAYLTECWVGFDEDDEKTWPYPKIVDGEKRWLVRYGIQPWEVDFIRFSNGEWAGAKRTVISYLDVADILPEGM